MKQENETVDDHHCSVIEREKIKAEMAECDTNSGDSEAAEKCKDAVKETSRKREQACKYS